METSENILEAMNSLLKPLEQDLEAHKNKRLKAATIESYRRIYERTQSQICIENMQSLHDVIKLTRSKNTYFARVAALKFINIDSITQQVELVNRALHDGRNIDAWHAIYSLKFFVSEWHEIASFPNKCVLSQKRPRQSKRSALNGLPDDWREKLYLRMARGKLGLPLLIASICGCRPIELAAGINISTTNDDGESKISIAIFGSKLTAKNGQPVRTLVFQSKNAPFLLSILANIVSENGGHVYVQIQNPKLFSSTITKYSKFLWPKHKHDVTAYCLRHAASSDWKSNLSSEELAIALGHASTRTQKSYGQRQQAKTKGNMTPICVLGTREVRISNNNFLDQKMSKQSTNFEPT
jgi:integrase